MRRTCILRSLFCFCDHGMARRTRKIYSQSTTCARMRLQSLPSYILTRRQRHYRNDFRFFTLKMPSPSSSFCLCYETSTFTGVSNLSFQKQTIFPRITFFLSNPFPSLCCIFFRAVSVGFKM